MKVQLAHILQSLYRTTELDEVPLHRLQETVRQYPYFTAAHFLLAQKLKGEQSEQYDEQAQKAAVYFHDPLWMQWQLTEGLVESSTNGTVTTVAGMGVEPIVAQEEIIARDEVIAEDNIATENEIEEIETYPDFREQAEEQVVADVQLGEPAPEETYTEDEVPEVQKEITDTPQPVSFVENLDVAASPEAYIQETKPADIPAPQDPEPKPPEEPEMSTQEPEPAPIPETVSNDDDGTPEPSSELVRNESDERPVDDTAPVVQQVDQKQEPQLSAPPKESIPFDPYYTIDYFAYQGIKPPIDVPPGDKLGKQLKSFTEWLKTMKRLPEAAIGKQVTDAEQQHIRRSAEGSLEGKEVVTETMAEVLIKQDKKGEAIGIYEKLSLLDPSKSAYFAAKIENLKRELI